MVYKYLRKEIIAHRKHHPAHCHISVAIIKYSGVLKAGLPYLHNSHTL